MSSNQKVTNDKGKVRVYFCLDRDVAEPTPGEDLLIFPTGNTKWNDFGHSAQIDYLFLNPGVAQGPSVSGFIGFINRDSKNNNGVKHLMELLSASNEEKMLAVGELKFFTMLRSIEDYRSVVRTLGVERARAFLLAAYDLVALHEFQSGVEWLEAAVSSEIFTVAFMRNAESFFAFKNAGSVLRGLINEELGRMSQSLALSFQLPGRINKHDLNFNFDHTSLLPKRIAVIIGKNGVGKSQTLGRIVKAALKGDEDLLDGNTGERAIVSRILAFAPTNEAESVFPSDRQSKPRIWYRRFSLNRARRSKRNEGLADLIVQVARSRQTIKNQSRFNIFWKAIQAISDFEQIKLQTKGVDVSYVDLEKFDRGNELRLLERYASIDSNKEPVRVVGGQAYPLSSGEISFLKFVAQVSLNIENGSLLLLDEPETHLHPNFISRFVSLLDPLLEDTGSAAIIATHSVYFVRETFREQVTVISVDSENRVLAVQPTLRTFGADVGAISYFVFGEDEPSYLATTLKEKLVNSQVQWSTLYETYRSEFSMEFLNELREASEEGKSND